MEIEENRSEMERKVGAATEAARGLADQVRADSARDPEWADWAETALRVVNGERARWELHRAAFGAPYLRTPTQSAVMYACRAILWAQKARRQAEDPGAGAQYTLDGAYFVAANAAGTACICAQIAREDAANAA